MSERTRFSLVKGIEPRSVAGLIATAKAIFPGAAPESSKWDDWQPAVQPTTFHACLLGNVLVLWDDAWRLAEQIAAIVGGPHMELRIQEGDHWDFTLYSGSKTVADFSTRVGYFDEDPTSARPWKCGDARIFSQVWNTPIDHVLPYLVDWDMPNRPEFAKTTDEFPIGDWRQIFDFMRAIGVEFPASDDAIFPIAVAVWRSQYMRRPVWRRIIRELSFWLKGTYPDRPRRQSQPIPTVTIRRM